MGGSSPTSTPVQVQQPIHPPGSGFAEAFYSQILPQLMQQGFPSYGESMDPGLSPTMGALIRGGQTFAASPFSDSFQQAGSTLGGFMNTNYENPMASQDPNRYGFDYNPSDFQPKPPGPPQGAPQSLQAAAASMGTPMGGQAPQGAPWSGAADNGVNSVTAQAGAPFPIDPGGNTRDPRAPGTMINPNQDPTQPAGPFTRRPSPGHDPNNPVGGGGGGGGGLPGSSSGSPGAGTGAAPGAAPTAGTAANIPPWLKKAMLAAGLNLADSAFTDSGGAYTPGGYDAGKPEVPDLGNFNVGNYNPMPGGQGFVDYNPGSPTINIGPGMTTGTYGPQNPMPPGPYPGPGPGAPGGGGGGGGATNDDPNWFGRHRGVNKGKSKEEVVFDMWTRGHPMGQDYTPPPALVKKYEEQGLPTTFGGRQTTQAELDAKARTYGGGGGGAPPPQPPAQAPPPSQTPTTGVQAPPMPGPPVYQAANAYSQSGAPAGGK